MKLVVGLGNPTRTYAHTRHNVGFQVVDLLAERWHTTFGASKFQARVADGRVDGDKVALVKPDTYMNNSGEAVGALARYYRVDPGDLLVVYDDVDLPLGRLRLRASGSAGTHNGMRSVVQHLGTRDFPRLRVGIGGGRPGQDLSAHVLGRFAADERPDVDRAVGRAADCVERVVGGDWTGAMNTFNERPAPLATPEEE